MFCALASHYRVPPFPNLIPRRNDFSFLKDNSCSKWSSRCSRVSQNEICRSEQEAFIVFFDVPSCQPFFGWKSHFAILTECLAGVRLEESCSPPPTRFIRGQRVGRDVCVQTRDSVALYLWTLGRKSQSGSWVNTIISTKLFVCVCVCTSQHHCRVWQAHSLRWETAPRRPQWDWK